jgi:hypothetical protein
MIYKMWHVRLEGTHSFCTVISEGLTDNKWPSSTKRWLGHVERMPEKREREKLRNGS